MSYQELKQVLSTQNEQKIEEYLEKIPFETLLNIVSSKLTGSNINENFDPSTIKLIGDILKYYGTKENALKKKRKLIISMLQIFKETQLNNKDLSNIINVIVFNFQTFSPSHLKSLVDYCLECIHNNDDESMCWKDLLPSLLQLLQDEKLVIEDSSTTSGREFKSSVIKKICREDWDKSMLTSLAKMFSEISIAKQELDMVNKVLCQNLARADINELPPLVHQMLKLNEDDVELLLFTLSNYFSAKYNEADKEEEEDFCSQIGKVSIKEIQDTESTILYYIHQATLINQKSLKNFIKFLRSNTAAPEILIQPFVMSVLLLLTETHPEVFEILKSAMTRSAQDEAKKKHSIWYRNMTQTDWAAREVITQIIINSNNKDRHLVLQGLVDFAFILMSSNVKKLNEEHRLEKIGSYILQTVLRKRHAAGSFILQELTTNIVEHRTDNSFYYTDCLAYICEKFTMVVNDHKASMITLIDQLSLLPGTTAMQVIKAILPIVSNSSTVKDAFILVLRKCLYKKGTETREMAVTGFLQLLKKIKLVSLNVLSQSSSSYTLSQNTSVILTQATLEKQKNMTSNPKNNTALSEEILSILKKCFSHEFEVRVELYKGLYEVVASNAELAELIMKLLLDRFISFYNPNEDIMPPIDLKKCIAAQGADMIVQEPIGHLIHSLQKMYVSQADRNTPTIDRLSTILESLCKRMAQLELEHLQMEDTIEFMDDIPTALQKLQGLKLCITTIEALIAFRIDSWSISSVHFAQNIYALVNAYKRLLEFTKKVNKPKRDGKKKDKDVDKDANDTTINKKNTRNSVFNQALKLPVTILEFKTINKILQLLYQESVPWASQEQSTNLRGRVEFHRYIFEKLLEMLQNAKTQKSIDVQHFKDYKNIGKLLYQNIILQLEQVCRFNNIICVLALECFKELCELMCTSLKNQLPKFLEALTDVERLEGLDAQFRQIIPTLLEIVENAVQTNEENEDPNEKSIPTILIATISHLLHEMPFEKGDNKLILNRLYELANSVEDTSIINSLVKMLLSVEKTVDPKSTILRQLCDDLLLESGSLDDKVYDAERKTKFINESTVKDMYEIINLALAEKLNDVDWYFSRLKAEQNLITMRLNKESDSDELRQKERNLCSQLNILVEIFEVMTYTKQKSFITDIIFRNLQHLFNILCKLIKYFSSKSTADNPSFQSVGFISVIKRAGKEVKKQFYNFVTFFEMNQKIDGNKDNEFHRKQILKETKMIPKVVFEIEEFYKEIVFFERKTNVPLGQFIKKTINRDFRIQDDVLEEGLEAMDVSNLNTQATTYTGQLTETEQESNIDDSSTTETPVRTKKRKM